MPVMIRLMSFFLAVGLLLLGACSSTPKVSSESISVDRAKVFFGKYCSELSRSGELSHSLRGEVIVRSNNRDFKGQYPASIRVSKENEFTLEITNVIGGTVGLINGNSKSIDVIFPGKPHLNRKSISTYLGIPASFFVQLIHGGLPCPEINELRVEGNEMVIRSLGQEWRYQQSEEDAGLVPVHLKVVENGKLKIELVIDLWNQEGNYAEKVKVQTNEGQIKWSWRSRALEK